MDKHILLVQSEIQTTRAKDNRNLVSFHKQQRLCFNATTLEKCNIYYGMYARFIEVDCEKRTITIAVRKDRPKWDKSKWYKITNPKVSKYNNYCYIRTTNLLYDHDILPLGAFEYEVFESNVGLIFIKISF